MTISRIDAVPEPQRNNEDVTSNKKNNKPTSIFDYDGNGTITTEEQSIALNNKLSPLYEKFKKVLNKFNFDEFKNKYISQLKTIKVEDDKPIQLAEIQIDTLLIHAQSELLEEVKNAHNKKIEELKDTLTSAVHVLLMSLDISEQGQKKAEKYKQNISELIMSEPELEDWGKNLIQELDNTYSNQHFNKADN